MKQWFVVSDSWMVARVTIPSLLLAFLLAVALTGCQTTAGNKPTPAEVTAKVCPSLMATVRVLMASPSVTDGAKEEMVRVAPLAHALCAPGAVTDVTGLADLADVTLPTLMTAVSTSTLPDADKNNLLLAIALVQIAVNTVKY
jgi:hypothetical protein